MSTPMTTSPKLAERRIPVNTADPSPMLLWEALDDLRQGLVLHLLTGSLALVPLAIGLIAALIIVPAFTMQVIGGVIAAISACTIVYLCWYSRFVSLNVQRGTLC